ncbi:hypothetical protein GBA52_012734 [Prunus armeniaca]|nr:hypothetical protein GBA52_012734 [Prunus armeniaca]
MYFFLSTDNTSVIRSLLTDYGILQQLRWNDAVNHWEELFAAPKYRCDRYGQCGANSKCSPDNINMFECECLPGYEPKSSDHWNRRDGSDGCVSKRIGVSNCGDGDGFVKVARVKDPDTLKAAQLLTSTSASECEQVCLSNCSCTAYMSIEWEGSIDCLAWYAENTRKSKGFIKSRGLLAIPMAAVALVLIIGFACWWLKKKRKAKDTLLPGMKVGLNWKIGLEWVLTSWKSQNDPGTGNYSLRLFSNQTATPQYFLWVLTDYGLNQQLRWSDAVNQWEELWAAPKYRCDQYGQCGANSKCSPDNVNMFECECLPGYEPKSLNDWNRRDGSEGCVSKRIGLPECGNGEGFVKVARVKEPDTTKAAQLLTSISANQCEQVCLSNCSCTAYMSIEGEGRMDCLVWYGELLDILVRTELGQDLYVRVDKMELGTTCLAKENFNYKYSESMTTGLVLASI